MLLEHMHFTMTFYFRVETAAKWLIGGECIQHRYNGQRDASRPRCDKATWWGISSCYSEWHRISKLRYVHYWNIPFGTFRTQLTKTKESKTRGNGFAPILLYAQGVILESTKFVSSQKKICIKMWCRNTQPPKMTLKTIIIN